MKQIRHGVFETNSSSTHSLTMCLKADYELFKAGKLILDADGVLIPVTDDIRKEIRDDPDWNDYKTFDQIGEEKDSFESEVTTPSGDVVVAFGEYGYDG